MKVKFICLKAKKKKFLFKSQKISNFLLFQKKKFTGHYVIVADWNRNEYFDEKEFCNEFKLLDLRKLENCMAACEGVEWVFNLAADMGGMGFIQSNHSTILYNNIMISYNMVEAATRSGVKRFFYSSSACIYPETIQTDTNATALKEGFTLFVYNFTNIY